MIPTLHVPLTGVRLVSLYLVVLLVGAIALTAIQGWAG